MQKSQLSSSSAPKRLRQSQRESASMQRTSPAIRSLDHPETERNSELSTKEPGKYQIRAKKGFLTAKDVTSGLVLLVYSKEFQLGVLLHLPNFSAPVSGNEADGSFTKSALTMILAEFEALGVPRAKLVTYVIGGSAANALPGVNKTAVQRMLWQFGLCLSASDLGRKQARSIWMDVETGRTIVRSEQLSTNGLPVGAPVPLAS